MTMNGVILARFRRVGTRQTGAALFISLVFLFILTVIGLSGMQNTSLQEKMAGNMYERNLAFQSAESALRTGEEILRNPVTRCTLKFICADDKDGLYDNSAPGSATDCPSTKGWPSSNQVNLDAVVSDNFWKSNNNPDLLLIDPELRGAFRNLADNPKYVMEKISPGASPPVSTSLEAGKPKQHVPIYYRVTARGVGRADNAVVVIQTAVRYFDECR